MVLESRHVLICCFVILTLLPSHVSSLRCYQCYSNSLEPCPYEDLQECPRFSFYNRCSVKVRKMITGEMFVKRECSLGCSDGSDSWNRDLNVSNTYFFPHCPPCIQFPHPPPSSPSLFPIFCRHTGTGTGRGSTSGSSCCSLLLHASPETSSFPPPVCRAMTTSCFMALRHALSSLPLCPLHASRVLRYLRQDSRNGEPTILIFF